MESNYFHTTMLSLPAQDFSETKELLNPRNIDMEMLCDYALEAADWSTELPHLDFAVSSRPKLTQPGSVRPYMHYSTINLDHTGCVVMNIILIGHSCYSHRVGSLGLLGSLG